MKKFYLIIILLASSIVIANAGDIPLSNYVNVKNPGGVTRVKTVGPSVTATEETDLIRVNFFRDLGTVTTTVYDEFGEVVYQNETASANGVVEIIDTTGLEEGEYTIVITNNSGTHLEGNFVL